MRQQVVDKTRDYRVSRGLEAAERYCEGLATEAELTAAAEAEDAATFAADAAAAAAEAEDAATFAADAAAAAAEAEAH